MKLTDKQRGEIFVALGAASMCWTGTCTGTFDSTRCEEIGHNLIRLLESSGAPAEQTFDSAMDAIAALRDLYYACAEADAHGELSNYIDGAFLDRAKAVLAQHQ